MQRFVFLCFDKHHDHPDNRKMFQWKGWRGYRREHLKGGRVHIIRRLEGVGLGWVVLEVVLEVVSEDVNCVIKA